MSNTIHPNYRDNPSHAYTPAVTVATPEGYLLAFWSVYGVYPRLPHESKLPSEWTFAELAQTADAQAHSKPIWVFCFRTQDDEHALFVATNGCEAASSGSPSKAIRACHGLPNDTTSITNLPMATTL